MTAPVLEHTYDPYRGAARALFGCRDPEVLLSGPAGTGKSRACLEKLHMMALINSGMRGLIVRKSLSSLGSTALDTWRKFVIKEALQAGIVTYYGGSAEEPPQYQYPNGSRVYIGGLDKSIKIMSAEYDVVYVQEATELSLTDWEAITTRLRNWKISFQQLIADCNPDAPHHWLKKRADDGVVTLLESRHEDNPRLFDRAGVVLPEGAAYIAKLDRLTGVRYHRLRRGMWVAAEGVIYDTWDANIHLVDQFIPPNSWLRSASCDFGYTNPFVFQWWAEDPDGRLYLYREIYMTQRTVAKHAATIKALGANDPPLQRIICDHDAEGRAVLEQALGISTRNAHKAVTEGIQAVQQRMAPDGTGRPRMMIMRDARVEVDGNLVDANLPTSTAEEIVGYIWNDAKLKEEPVKKGDHGMDAMRYRVAAEDLGARVGARVLTW